MHNYKNLNFVINIGSHKMPAKCGSAVPATKIKAQSAMEFLMTYGWAIIVIAVVLAALFELGVFNGSNLGPQACIAQAGFICKNPVFTSQGIGMIIGQTTSQDLYGDWFFVAAEGAPLNSSGIPVGFAGNSIPIALSTGNVLVPGHTVYAAMPSTYFAAAGIPSNALTGTPFAGYVWLGYCLTPCSKPQQYSKIATLSLKSSGSAFVGGLIPLSATISPTSDTIFMGQSITFTANAVGGKPPYTFVLTTTPSTGTTVTGDTVSFSSNGVYAVLLTVTDSTGTHATAGAQVTVNIPPLTASISPTSNTIDAGGSVTFTPSSSGGVPPVTYSYSVSPSGGVTISGNTITFANYGAYFVTLTATDSVSQTATAQASVGVSPPMVVGTPTLSSSSPVAFGSQETLTSHVSYGTTPYSYQWKSGSSQSCGSDSAIGGATSSTYSLTAPSTPETLYYCYTVTDAADSSASSNTVAIQFIQGCSNNMASAQDGCAGSVTYTSSMSLTGDVNASGSITINGGVTVTTQGYAFIAGGSFTNSGQINTGTDPQQNYPNSYGGSGGSTHWRYCCGSGGYSTIAGGANTGCCRAGGNNGGTPTLSASTVQSSASSWYSSGIQQYLAGAAGGNNCCGDSNGQGSYGIYIQASSLSPGSINANGGGGGKNCYWCGGWGSPGAGGGGGAVVLAFNTSLSSTGSVSYGGGGSCCGRGPGAGGGGAGAFVTLNFGTSPPVKPA